MHNRLARPRSALLAALILAGCGASPAPEFMGAQRADVVRDGRSYTVFYTERRAEVIRLGWASAGAHRNIRAQMIDLIPDVTGCRLVESTVTGDSGEMRASIICPKK